MLTDHLVKVRYLLAIERDAYAAGQRALDGFSVRLLDAGHRAACDWISSRIGPERLARRLQDPDCTGFVACSGEGGQPVGFYWALCPGETVRWHDKFPVPPGAALLFNAWVDEKYRGRGVYRMLVAAAHDHVFFTKGCSKAFTIVERRNRASLAANLRFGLHKEAVNTLVKCVVPILSIYVGPGGTRCFWVLGNAKRRSV